MSWKHELHICMPAIARQNSEFYSILLSGFTVLTVVKVQGENIVILYFFSRVVYVLNWLSACAKPAGMAHSSEVFHAVSGALTNSGMCNNMGEIPPPTAQNSNAKQRRLSRANTSEEIRYKKRERRKRKRKEENKISKKQKKLNLLDRVTKQVDKARAGEIRESSLRAENSWKKAGFFWKKWKEERLERSNVVP